MSSEMAIDIDEAEVALLATGFALGELEEEELQRLYDLLRQPGEHGAAAARIAWRTLGTTVDLRASLAGTFQETVRKKLQTLDQPAQERRFLGGILSRIGRQRRGLEAVAMPNEAKARRWSGLLLLLPLAALAVLILLWFQEQAPRNGARVISLNGAVSSEGRMLSIGDQVEQQVIAIPRGGRLHLQWATGHEAWFVGPAFAVPNADDSLSLMNGQAQVRSEQAFSLGLPDRKLFLDAGDTITVQVANQTSQIGVDAGTISIDGESGRIELGAKQAIAAGSEAFAWMSTHDRRAELIEVPAISQAATWDLQGTIGFSNEADRVMLTDGVASLVIAPGRLSLSRGDDSQELATLDGPPLQARRLKCGRGLDGRPFLSISGHSGDLAWPFHTNPVRLETKGRATVEALQLRTGPKPVATGR